MNKHASSPWVAYATVGLGIAALPTVAMAQSSGNATNPDELEEVVVTGTSIRGVAPTGSELITVGRGQIEIAPVADVQQLLTQVPQLGAFNAIGSRMSSTTQDQTQNNPGPAIHNIRGGTLTLLNGHRFAGGGILQVYPDPSVIPLMALERVEIVPDGASGVYGADAVAGVANFITRKKIDGAELSARLGTDGSGYDTYTGSFGFGRDWSSGSALLAYQYAGNSTIRVRDRAYLGPDQSYRGGVNSDGTFCSPANVTVNNVTYALPNAVAGTTNRCNALGSNSLVPASQQHAVYGKVTQELTERITLTADLNYSSRMRTNYGVGNAASNYTITSTSPFYRSLDSTTANQTVSYNPEFDFPNAHVEQSQKNFIASVGLDVQLANDWHLSTLIDGSTERDEQNSYAPVPEAIRAAISAGAFNPYGVGAANNPAVLASVSSYRLPQTTATSLLEGTVKLDGSIYTLPGGDVKIAVGAASRRETIAQKIVNFASVQQNSGSRTVTSGFAEVFVPVVSDANAKSMLQSLELSGAVRMDRYSRLGSTTNPKFGVKYAPVKGFALRSSYGTSFNAPNMGETYAVNTQVVGFGPFVFPTGTYTALITNGGNVNLKPQTADTYSFGMEWSDLESLPGFHLSLSYFNVSYKNLIGQPDPAQTGVCLQRLPACDPALQQYFNPNPTAGELAAVLAVGPLRAVSPGPYNAIIDGQQHNLGLAKTAGIDFDTAYQLRTGFGDINFGLAGTLFTKRTQKSTPTSASVDVNDRSPKLTLRGSVGITAGALDGSLAINHIQGYDNIAATPKQAVSAYTTYDVHAGYVFENLIGKNVRLGFDVSNLFDEDAPYVIPALQNSLSFSNSYASAVGRTFSVSASVKF